MRICFVADAGSIHTRKWVKYFADKGHEVHLISHKSFGNDKNVKAENYVLKIVFPRIKIISTLINIILFLVQIRVLVRKIKPDVLHAHYITDYGFIAALSGFHPLVMSMWGSDVFMDPHKSIFNRYSVRFALRRADLVTTGSRYAADYIKQEFNVSLNKIKSVPWGVDTNTFLEGYQSEVIELRKNLKVEDNSFIVISPRTMSEHYGIEFIIRSIPYVINKYPKTIFIFLRGFSKDTSYENKLRTNAEDLGIDKYTRFVSRWLEPKEMAIYYNMSDVFIAIPRTDQFAACTVEGMACGSIPIMSNLEVYREYLIDGESAFFVNREDPEDIANKVLYCIGHPELKEKIYRLNRETAEKYLDWNKNALRVEEWHHRILEGKLPE